MDINYWLTLFPSKVPGHSLRDSLRDFILCLIWRGIKKCTCNWRKYISQFLTWVLYGRHPVLPVDVICLTDPNPFKIVSVESGGPSSYEEWMLVNLQKTFTEVNHKSNQQTIQTTQKTCTRNGAILKRS